MGEDETAHRADQATRSGPAVTHVSRITHHPPVRLLILDGDDTLWRPIDGICCSDRDPDDRIGWEHFQFRSDPTNPERIVREDGVRFDLTAGAREAIRAVTDAGGICALASFNHRGNLVRALAAWGLADYFPTVVGHWHARKGEMLTEILAAEAAAGRPVAPHEALFVDDDPYGTYRGYAAEHGIAFVQMGPEIRDFYDLLPRLDARAA